MAHKGGVRITFINVYMPYENDEDSREEFSLQLSVVDEVIERNADSHVICGGDFNVDFNRDWSHSTILDEFVKMYLCILPLNMTLMKWIIRTILICNGLLWSIIFYLAISCFRTLFVKWLLYMMWIIDLIMTPLPFTWS